MESTVTENRYNSVSPGSQAAGSDIRDRYALFSGGIIAGIEQKKDESWIYRLSYPRLSRQEKEIFTTINATIPGESASKEGDFLKTIEEYRKLVAKIFPSLPEKEEIKIVSRLFTGTDPVMWVPVILTDPWISSVLLPLQGGHIRVCHEKIPSVLITGIVLSKTDLDRFASLFMNSPETLDSVTKPFCRKDYQSPIVISQDISEEPDPCLIITKPSVLLVPDSESAARLAVRHKNNDVRQEFQIQRYRLLSDTVTVSLVPAVMYEISLVELSGEGTSIYRAIIKDLEEKNLIDENREKNHDQYRKTCQVLLKKHAPGIERDQKTCILAWLLIHNDPVTWIRTILLDPAVREIECLAPGIPVSVRHISSSHSIPANITLDHSELEKVAAYFLQSSGISPDTKKPVQVRFRTGETLSITRILSQDGDYPRISIIKKSQKKSEAPLRISGQVSDSTPSNLPVPDEYAESDMVSGTSSADPVEDPQSSSLIRDEYSESDMVSGTSPVEPGNDPRPSSPGQVTDVFMDSGPVKMVSVPPPDCVLDPEHAKRIEEILTAIFSQQSASSNAGQIYTGSTLRVDTVFPDRPEEDTGFLERFTESISEKALKIASLTKKAGHAKRADRKPVLQGVFTSAISLSHSFKTGDRQNGSSSFLDTILSSVPDKDVAERLMGSLLGKKVKFVSSKKKTDIPGRKGQKPVFMSDTPAKGISPDHYETDRVQAGSGDAGLPEIRRTDFQTNK